VQGEDGKVTQVVDYLIEKNVKQNSLLLKRAYEALFIKFILITK
jgi:hypothetical protein